MKIILASTSRYRRELVARLGLDVECVAPPYDEEVDKAAHPHLPLPDLARHLARGKARSLAAEHPDALVIGSDQIAEIDGWRLSKPHTPEGARTQLRRLAGREHRLHTAVALHHGATGRTEEALDVHRLKMRALTDDEIDAYVRRDAPLDCAGSYRVESLGVALFERITGDDYTAVIGLPLTRLTELLGRFGVSVLA
jgi:septum formation protein